MFGEVCVFFLGGVLLIIGGAAYGSSYAIEGCYKTLQDEVLDAARRAKEAGSTRFCMGTAWRGVGQKNSFQHILTMVKVLV